MRTVHQFQRANGARIAYEHDADTGEVVPHGALTEQEIERIKIIHRKPWAFDADAFEALMQSMTAIRVGLDNLARAVETVAAQIERARTS